MVTTTQGTIPANLWYKHVVQREDKFRVNSKIKEEAQLISGSQVVYTGVQ